MPFILRNISVSPAEGDETLLDWAAKHLGLPVMHINNLRIVRKAVDARRRGRAVLVYTVSFDVVDDQVVRGLLGRVAGLEWQAPKSAPTFRRIETAERILIVGSGPAGLFSALRLAEYGITATVIERGQPVERRSSDVSRFWRDGLLDPESNVQFGEGGAGTFSDGKLTNRSKDPLSPWVLQRFTDFGAPPEILYQAKPHIGTDRLRHVVAAMRNYLIDKGFEVRFGSRLTDISMFDGKVSAAIINDIEELPCDRLVLATGHSARDTYKMLEARGVALEAKPFAIGVRIEHPQGVIDNIQYGGARHPNLPPADYALAWNNTATGRSAYSFCMCPGGIVIAAASEAGGVVTNGMSGQRRNSPFANSALVVNVRPEDFGGQGPLAGIEFQRYWEQQAFTAAGGGYLAPACNMLDFMGMSAQGGLSATYRPGIVACALDEVLPDFVVRTLREGITDFGRRLRGFLTAEATLIGIESRTSAPLRILRDAAFESLSVRCLYPAGEGAGYAGGIMSSAVDGVKIADRIAAEMQ